MLKIDSNNRSANTALIVSTLRGLCNYIFIGVDGLEMLFLDAPVENEVFRILITFAKVNLVRRPSSLCAHEKTDILPVCVFKLTF